MPTVRLSVVPRTQPATEPRRGEPVSVGLPCVRGVFTDLDGCVWRGDDGVAWPVQADVRERWADGTVRWAMLHGRVSWPGTASSVVLDVTGQSRPAGPADLAVSEDAASITVETGAARFVMARDGHFPFARVIDAAGRDLLDRAAGGLVATAADGRPGVWRTSRVWVDSKGPQWAEVAWQGTLRLSPDSAWLDVEGRVEFFAGLSAVALSLTVRNPRPAAHPGNFWELGDAGSVLLRELRLDLAPSGGIREVWCSPDPDTAPAETELPFTLYQESSGGAHWNSPVHVNRDGRIVQNLPGYRITSGTTVTTGDRATPVVDARTPAGRVSVAVPVFWQNCPRAVSVTHDRLSLAFWPADYPDVHELQGGEQKTHACWVSFADDPVSAVPLDWCRRPALVCAEPLQYAAAAAVPHLTPEVSDADPLYRSLVHAALDGDETFAAKRERIDEYGWRHFGELYADHESVSAPSDRPLVSHYNNQYDAVAGFALQFFRSGDARWWAWMDDLAAHVVDIDLYHTDADKAAYSGGPFWHTCHYVDAGRSTHRGYPQAPGVYGGGPSNEHTYTSGLLLHYFLTGSTRSRDAVLQVADWVIRMDDGRYSPFRHFDRGETGLASATREPGYHGPGRGAANAMTALLDAFRLTGRQTYLDKAETLLRRCVHPDDDVAARGLLDAENRWSYTVFFQVLGRYLRDSADAGRLGPMYRWARESLLAYARWMAREERPYLDAPETLEYPTETWAAQDLRKGDVLLQASLHVVDADERRTFRERAAFFHETALRTLSGMPTRTLTRPVVLLLTNGVCRTWFEMRPEASLPAPADMETPLPPARAFVPQRVRAMAKARWVAGLAATVAALVVVGVLTW